MASALQYGIGFAWIGVLVGKAAGRPLHSALFALASSVNVTCLQYRQNVAPLPICIVCIALIYRAVLSRCGLSANANARNNAQLQTVMAAPSALPVTQRSAF